MAVDNNQGFEHFKLCMRYEKRLASYPGSFEGRREPGNHCMLMCQSYYKDMVSQKSL